MTEPMCLKTLVSNAIDIVGDELLFGGEVVAKLIVPEGTLRERFIERLWRLEVGLEDETDDAY